MLEIVETGTKGSGGMKGISTSPEQVAVWVNSFNEFCDEQPLDALE